MNDRKELLEGCDSKLERKVIAKMQSYLEVKDFDKGTDYLLKVFNLLHVTEPRPTYEQIENLVGISESGLKRCAKDFRRLAKFFAQGVKNWTVEVLKSGLDSLQAEKNVETEKNIRRENGTI